METNDTPNLIRQAAVAEGDLPELGLREGDLIVWLYNGKVMSVRRPPPEHQDRISVELLLGDMGVPGSGLERMDDGDPDAILFTQLLQEIERRWPDLA